MEVRQLYEPNQLLAEQLAETPNYGLALFGATAFVVASNAPLTIRRAALEAHALLGNRVRLCDGVNDEVDFQAAYNILTSGGLLMLSEGTFYISNSINPKSKVVLQGMGHYASILQRTTNANCPFFAHAATGLIGLQFKSFGLDGNSANNNGTAAQLRGFNFLAASANYGAPWVFEDLGIWDSKGYGICYSGGSAQIIIRDCLFTKGPANYQSNYGHIDIGSDGNGSGSILIANNKFHDSWGTNEWSLYLAPAITYRVIGNHFQNSEKDLQIRGPYASVIGNTSIGARKGFLECPYGHATIIGNNVQDCSLLNANLYDAITVNRANNVIVGNHIYSEDPLNNPRYGINLLSLTQECVVVGNVIANCGTANVFNQEKGSTNIVFANSGFFESNIVCFGDNVVCNNNNVVYG